MQPKGSLPHLQVPVTCHYHEPDQYSNPPPTHFLKSILIVSSHLRLIHRIQGGPNPSHFTIAAALWSLPKFIYRFNRSTTLRLTTILGVTLHLRRSLLPDEDD